MKLVSETKRKANDRPRVSLQVNNSSVAIEENGTESMCRYHQWVIMQPFSRLELVNLYLIYRQRSQSFQLHTWEMKQWYERVCLFNGDKQHFEAWFWDDTEGTLTPLQDIPRTLIQDSRGCFPCYFPDCRQQPGYESGQIRDAHFDSEHLGLPCSVCRK
ncbi:hypothetical protein FB446DRAFT_191611 [Lentinula raphanica]|nr:hypothetical protein FB446DRAFT_191611 [Lentinula raphanica]